MKYERKGLFTLDMLEVLPDTKDQFFVGYTDDQRWNGWETPTFTRGEGHRIVAGINRAVRTYEKDLAPGVDTAWYDAALDEFFFVQPDVAASLKPLTQTELVLLVRNGRIAEVDRYGPGYHDTPDGMKWLYPIGAFAWTWSAAPVKEDEDERTDHGEEAPTVPGRMWGAHFETAVQAAEDAFWAKMVELYPAVKTGDLDPVETFLFWDACKRAARAWLTWNHPLADDSHRGGA